MLCGRRYIGSAVASLAGAARAVSEITHRVRLIHAGSNPLQGSLHLTPDFSGSEKLLEFSGSIIEANMCIVENIYIYGK